MTTKFIFPRRQAATKVFPGAVFAARFSGLRAIQMQIRPGTGVRVIEMGREHKLDGRETCEKSGRWK